MYYVFEGMDGAGKSTIIKQVAATLSKVITNPINITFQPGNTPLGAHLRKLVKNSEEIDPAITIDPLSRQLFYIIDAISYSKSVLEPKLANLELVLSDRSSFISSIAYGSAEGLSHSEISKLFSVMDPPKISKLFILTCDLEISRSRISTRKSDYFDSKPAEFFDRLYHTYLGFVSGDSPYSDLVSKSVDLSDIVLINTQDNSIDSATTIICDSIVSDLEV